MDNFFVQLQGVASNIVLQRIRHQAKFVIEENNKYTSFLFLNYSNFDIPVGSEFLYFIELNEDEMYLSADEFLEKNAEVSFQSQFFWGQAVVIAVDYAQVHFKFTLKINSIKFQPGLLVNMKL